MHLNLAMNYGGRAEIINATKKISELVLTGKINIEQIDENIFEQNLYTKEQADPDLIIRTAGETRLSNFLLWQSAYSELFFTKKTWPDFNTTDFNFALDYYKSRARTFGATKMKKKSS